MKTGKYIQLGEYKNVKIGYGTIDSKNLKTIYLKLNSWLQPKKGDDEYSQIISSSRRAIKQHIFNLNDKRFKKENIVDLDIRSNGIKMEKKSFMNLEITLFINDSFELKSKETKKTITTFLVDIIDKILINKSLYNFYKTKK
jgi:hypothetical protein